MRELSNRRREAPASEGATRAIRRERRWGYVRSLAIAFAFAGPFSFVQNISPPLWSWISFGLPMGLAMPWLHTRLMVRLRHRSFLVTMIRQAVAYVVAIWICLSVSMLLSIAGGALPEASVRTVVGVWAEVITNRYFLGSLPVAVLFVLPIRFVMGLRRKLGPGVLSKWLRGYYHEPREEERIFMFLDMKDSTALAERLGNVRFSALVRDVFEDLTVPVLQTRAEVSHYIGDEAVLSWTIPRGVASSNCLRLFFEFERVLKRRGALYVERYGLVPGFKAGVHVGRVVATEVGEVKSEIVFHGDVLNTTARIQGLCGPLRAKCLVSADLIALLEIPPDLAAEDLGLHELKGKAAEVGVWAIRRAGEPA